jgi:uncharacterized protein (TIGR03435 family)
MLTVQSRKASGLKRNFSANASVSGSDGFILLSNVPLSHLSRLLEREGTPVVDRTGLAGFFDLKWDDTKPDGLKNAVQDKLGLALVPGKDRVECVVMYQAN